MNKIGITERGDAGIDLGWYKPVLDREVNGAVLITKNITPAFMTAVVELHNKGYKLMIHCTCTGFGKSELEPNVPRYDVQLDNLCKMIESGFPKEQCVLRVDPIIPTEKYMEYTESVLLYASQKSLLPGIRVRISVLDEYRHVKERLRQKGMETFYGQNFQASDDQLRYALDCLSVYQNVQFECCAENRLFEIAQKMGISNIRCAGCIGQNEAELMGIDTTGLSETAEHQRKECMCLPYKTELLQKKSQCPHGCIYCYWRS